MNELDYIAYFENLARQHKALRHSEQECHFFVVSDSSKAEIEQAIAKKLRLPALLLDQYLDDLETGHDNFRLRVMGGVTVLVKCQSGDAQDRRRARDEARTIALSLLNRMRRDVRTAGSALQQKGVVLDIEFKGEPAPFVLQSADGWGYGFEWLLPTSVKIDAEQWLDLP
ncbi:hypothetical protein G8759_31360 [Spirosoma aureum]|uniref:Uncharacterized protein n=1 Tax=Spirosoma aureum TaxID=2692134 RepID=A0A6G9AXA0_9BACT|nr:hypothetical protein [Spirosoma aureum]QIP16823.1 hypothetical protein G8759_31360 [Spirosoma aureum]